MLCRALLILLACGCGVGNWPGSGPNRPQRFTPSTGGVRPPVALDNPPDEYEIQLGQWGVDIDESQAVVRTGERSVWFKSSLVSQTRMRHDADHRVPVEAGRSYKAWAIVQADSTTTGTVSVAVAWFLADKSTRPITATSSVFDAAVDEAHAWQRVEAIVEAPEGARYAAISFGRDGTGLNAYFDEVDMDEAVPLWDLSTDFISPTFDGNGVFSTIALDSISVVDVSSTSGFSRVTIEVPGYYYVHGRARFSGFAAGEVISAQIFNATSGVARQGMWMPTVSTGSHAVEVSALLDCQAGDVVRLLFMANSGGATMTVDNAYFYGIRVM